MIQTKKALDPDRYGPWAVITGASAGIGEGFARQLAADGFDLVLAARRGERLTALGSELAARHGTSYRAVPVDLSEPGGAAKVIDATADLDVGLLISNAGAGLPGRFLDHDPAELHRIVRLNVHPHLDLAHHFGGRLVGRGRGGMVLVSAGGALHGLPNMVNDSATKAYVLNLGEGLHYELAPHGVDVLVLLPAAVDTPVIDAYGLSRDAMPIKPQSVDDCVALTLRALRRGRVKQVSPRLAGVMTRLLPRTVSIKMNGRMLAKASPAT
jgi:short-subunit dehydrogenase